MDNYNLTHVSAYWTYFLIVIVHKKIRKRREIESEICLPSQQCFCTRTRFQTEGQGKLGNGLFTAPSRQWSRVDDFLFSHNLVEINIIVINWN